MQDGLDWLLRPVLRGMCKYESLKGTELDLCDIAVMNEALDVEDENRNRAQSVNGG